MDKKNSQILMWSIAALAVIAAVVLFFVFTNKPAVGPVEDNQSVTTEPESSQDIGTQDVGAGAVSIAYSEALVKYADRRIQLDKDCQAFPANVTYKDNTGIMIDNRSAQTRTVKVGSTFTIKPWGFKIVVLPDVYLASKTILVDCGTRQNVATILVQE